MTLQESQRKFQEAEAQYREALTETQKIEDGLRASEARRVAGLREAGKLQLGEDAKVFESLGMSKGAAEFAARGRAA